MPFWDSLPVAIHPLRWKVALRAGVDLGTMGETEPKQKGQQTDELLLHSFARKLKFTLVLIQSSGA